MPDPVIRPATDADLAAITRIYDTYIVDSAISFDAEPWSAAKRQVWWEDHQGHPRLIVLVAERDGEVVGTTYSSWYRPKDAYRSSVETSIVLDPTAIGTGLGRRLYTELLTQLAAADTHRAYAYITIPNEPSIGLHHAMGFTDIGVQHECGFKLGQYWSTLALEKRF